MRKRGTPVRIGKYELGERIAVGGMSEVYSRAAAGLATRMVALKVLKDALFADPAVRDPCS